MSKLSSGARAVTLRVLVAAAAVQLLSAHGCAEPPSPQPDARLTLDVAQPTGTYRPGDTVSYRITVANPGPVGVNRVSVFPYVDYNFIRASTTCTVHGQATADTDDCTMMRTMEVGSSVTFDVVALVRSAEEATAPNFVQVDIVGGRGYRVETPVALANLPGAGYHAFTAGGRAFDVHVDAATAGIAFDGTGGRTLPYSGPDADGTWHLAGGAGWRETPDLLVGTADLGGGTQPFVAARSFVTATADLDHREFVMFERETLADGNTVTRVHSTSMLGTAMKICVDAAAPSLAACPAASVHDYYLRVNEGWFFATDTATPETTLQFRVARAGNTQILLRSEPSGTGRIFAIGLPAASNPVASTLVGGDTLGRWGTLTLAPASASLHETLGTAAGTALALDGALAATPHAPAGLFQGTLGDASAAVWITQQGPVALVAGKPGTPVDGLLQVFSR